MWRPSPVVLMVLIATSQIFASSLPSIRSSADEDSHLLPNVPATFGESPAPFVLNVDDAFIELQRELASQARAPIPVKNLHPADSDGPTLANFTRIKDYWAHDYDWKTVQASINRRLKQYTTTVKSSRSDYKSPVPLHFVHHRSPRKDAIPFLFLHGWPGSFLEVEHIIDRLTNPHNDSDPAFHVVAPSIPGFGFSPAPEYDGFGPKEAGHAFDALMQQLDYSKYVIQGGDFGGIILRFQAALYPHSVVSVLDNFWLIPPSKEDLARFAAGNTTADETAYLGRVTAYVDEGSGYRLIQQTQPLTMAYTLTGNPLGFAMWIYALMKVVIDTRVENFSPEEIITWSLMYTIQGPYGSLRMYKEMAAEGVFDVLELGKAPYVHQPVAISQFLEDLAYGLPLDWARREGNVKVRYVHDQGGHFAAYKDTQLLTEDIRDFFGNAELSGTGVFRKS